MTCFATTLFIREKHTRKPPKLYSVFQANAKTNKNITPKREHKISVSNRQFLMMLWLRTYPTSYKLSAMFGVSKSTNENVITELIVELLMSSRGHFLLIRVSIYQNVCIHE